MCTASTVMDGWRHPTWPIPNHPFQPITPMQPLGPHINPPTTGVNAIPWQTIVQDPALAKQMLEIISRLEKIDQRLDQLEKCKVAQEEKEKVKAELKKIAKKKKK